MDAFKLDRNWRIIFTIAAVAVVLYLLWFFRLIITYALIAVVVSLIGEPLMRLLRKLSIRGWMMPAWLRAVITLIVFFGVILSLGWMFVPVVTREIDIISRIDTAKIFQTLSQQWQSISDTVNTEKVDTSRLFTAVEGYLAQFLNFSWLGDIVQLIGNIAIGFASVVFMSFFFLKDGFLFTRIVFTLTPDKHLEKIKNIMEHTHDLLSRFFIGLCIQSLVMMTLVSVSLWILGVENALLIGIFAGMANVIPYVGPLLGGVFGLVIAVTTGLDANPYLEIWPLVLKVVAIFVVAQQIDGFVVQPLVLGNSVKAHPLEIFIVVLTAGTIGGIIGMIIAIPAYTILRVVAREFLSEFKWVESLTREMGDDAKE